MELDLRQVTAAEERFAFEQELEEVLIEIDVLDRILNQKQQRERELRELLSC